MTMLLFGNNVIIQTLKNNVIKQISKYDVIKQTPKYETIEKELIQDAYYNSPEQAQ